MSNSAERLSQSHDVSAKVAEMLQTRARTALERCGKRVQQAGERQLAGSVASPMLPWQAATSGAQYAVDFAQRSILFWDTLRQRGDNFLEHERKGLLPVLHFDYEMIMDGRAPTDKRVQRIQPSPEQKAMLARIRSVLDWAAHEPLRDRGAVVKRLKAGS